jgi:NADH-quinone oxidoreductase subunit L
MTHSAWLVPALPLLASLITALFGRRLGEKAHLPIVFGIGGAFLVSLGVLFSFDHPEKFLISEWINVGGLRVPFEFRVDGLTSMMLCMVTFIATLVALFASGYMAGDPGYTRFFAIVGLFVFSMTGLVLSNNFALTYGFWECVGACSYLLIGFWHEKPSAAAAAKKAFLVNRVGDLGFAIGLFWLWTIIPDGNLAYENVFGNLDRLADADRVGIALLFFWAATAKSAQVPLYVWLPDAMEGPTPVSALIHAATMVTAGVYLIARSAPLLVGLDSVAPIIASIGCLTALMAGFFALTQNDLKRVLAYSTISQIGFMFMGLGSGIGSVAKFAVVAGMFHLFTHAFFKALLFLGSGSVMHAMGHVIDMRRFSGLKTRMPSTYWTFLAGSLALAGLPPLSGFWSKDEVLAALKLAAHEAEHAELHGAASLYGAIYWLALFTAGMTAFYTFRALFKTFHGPEKLPSPDDPEAEHDDLGHHHGDDPYFGKESPAVMTLPLKILAVCAIGVGLVFAEPTTGWFAHLVEHSVGFEERLPHAEPHGFDWATAVLGTISGGLGLSLAYVMYGRPSPLPAKLAGTLKPIYEASLNKLWVDEIYHALFVAPVLVLAQLCRYFDIYGIDGMVRTCARIPANFARGQLQRFQGGAVQGYASVAAVAVVGLLALLVFT